MKSTFKCSICKDTKQNLFATKNAALGHVMEKHSSFGWQCIFCEYVTAREDGKHLHCSKGDRPFTSRCYNRLTGSTGEETRKAFEDYRRQKL